jgi:patched 1 protein
MHKLQEIRAISENYTLAGVPNHPSGIAFTFWEQYLDLNWNLVKAISVISIAVFIVVSIMLFSPWAAACILLILLMMTVELAGFISFCNIKLNPVSAVSLITAVGIGVEFTAHVVFSFITAPGSRDERMAQAVDQVFVPVLHGALSTLLGIIMLGFSDFDFVVKYFFVIMSALIIIGLLNGLMLLPVILSLFGPNSKVFCTIL